MKSFWNRIVMAALAVSGIAAAAPADCERLGGGSTLGNATVLSARNVPAGSYTGSDGQRHADLPAFCRVVARATPSPQSNIVIEIWLPEPAAWNRKLLDTGNGGFAGTIRSSALAGGLRRGYAVSNTDMGTYPAGFPGVGYEAGNGRPDAVKDWGHRATHAMAVLSKAVAAKYYGERATRSYFAGCSTGGHQGLMEAQRYPDDYDAILAGAPGHNRTHLHAMFAFLAISGRAPGAAMQRQHWTLWSGAMMKACAGKDGGAPGDTFLTDPTQCQFSPRELLCKAGQDSAECLQEAQVKLLEAIYGGTRNPRTGGLIYPPEVRGVEAMFAMASNPRGISAPISTDLSRWVFGPGWDGATFDFDRDMAKVDEALGRDINALDPDLSRFAARGGKLILFHGWADAVVSPIDSVLHYDRVTARGRDKRDFVRLFMAPGVSHCSGGAGPDSFGQGAEFRAGDASGDLLAALDRWVETGVAPESVLAVKYKGGSPTGPPPADAPVIASRPLCAYPKVARYSGPGDATSAASFVCSDAPPARYEKPAREYLR